MSFGARVFRILIASPSDVSEEREIAVNTIQAWNDLNSGERQIVLLPLRWETHSAPEYGRRPQEVINRQVVDHCDLLVGIFWTRIGSPTGAADSGTLEEIERVATQGKPVMLYFSQTKQDPDRIDLEQLQQLREFKKKTFPKALVESYSSQIEFRDKLSKQLEIQLRTLLTEENQENSQIKTTPTTEIKFEFADPRSGSALGSEIELQTTVLKVDGLEELPDFADEAPASRKQAIDVSGWFERGNKDFYREMAAHLVRQSFFRPVRFWLKNAGGLGARDIYIDVRITSNDTPLVVKPFKEDAPPQESGLHYYGGIWSASGDEAPEKLGNQWTTKLELPALQPQREITPKPSILVGANQSGLVTIIARIFADTLSEPLTRSLQIKWIVNEVRKSAKELLEEAGIKVRSPKPVDVKRTANDG
jgi:nucleoside 2-deoxyribosyltransferase